MPQRRKSKLSRPKKRRATGLTHVDARRDNALSLSSGCSDNAAVGSRAPASQGSVEEESRSRHYAAARLRNYALMAWSHNYKRLFEIEAAANGAHEAVSEYVSTYRQRQIRKGGAMAEEAVQRSAVRISHDYERLARERCMHHIPFSQVVKGASMLVDQVLPILFRMLVCSCSQFVLC